MVGIRDPVIPLLEQSIQQGAAVTKLLRNERIAKRWVSIPHIMRQLPGQTVQWKCHASLHGRCGETDAELASAGSGHLLQTLYQGLTWMRRRFQSCTPPCMLCVATVPSREVGSVAKRSTHILWAPRACLTQATNRSMATQPLIPQLLHPVERISTTNPWPHLPPASRLQRLHII